MGAYILRRLLLIIPTLIGIMAINFAVIQFAPGGPVERIIAQVTGTDVSATQRISGGGSDFSGTGASQGGGDDISSKYRGAQGLDPEFIADLEKQFGFDKPPLERFLTMLGNYATFDFGESYFRDIGVLELILEKMPVSISLGLWMTLISYLISIPPGHPQGGERTARASMSGRALWSSLAMPFRASSSRCFWWCFSLAGPFFDLFPLRGLVSDNFDELSLGGKILDYFWHLVLPLTSMALSAFATTTLLTKNSFLDEIRKQYVVTARAKGLTERQVLYRHVFRNAMLIIIARFPRSLHRRLLWRLAADRDDLLPRRPGAPVL